MKATGGGKTPKCSAKVTDGTPTRIPLSRFWNDGYERSLPQHTRFNAIKMSNFKLKELQRFCKMFSVNIVNNPHELRRWKQMATLQNIFLSF